jgi:hypothetical protein
VNKTSRAVKLHVFTVLGLFVLGFPAWVIADVVVDKTGGDWQTPDPRPFLRVLLALVMISFLVAFWRAGGPARIARWERYGYWMGALVIGLFSARVSAWVSVALCVVLFVGALTPVDRWRQR